MNCLEHVFFKPRPRPSGLRRSDPDRDLTFFFPVQVSVTFHYYSDGHVAGLQRTAKSSHRHSRHVIPQSDSNRQPLESGADCQFYQLSCIKLSPIQSSLKLNSFAPFTVRLASAALCTGVGAERGIVLTLQSAKLNCNGR